MNFNPTHSWIIKSGMCSKIKRIVIKESICSFIQSFAHQLRSLAQGTRRVTKGLVGRTVVFFLSEENGLVEKMHHVGDG